MNLHDLSSALALQLHGDPSAEIQGLASIEQAGPEHLTFVVGARYADRLRASRAGAVIVPRTMQSIAPGNALISDNPYASYAQASWLLYPPSPVVPGVHGSAIIDAGAQVADSASIGPGVVIGAGARIGERASVSARCHIGADCEVGADSQLSVGVTLVQRVRIGQDCRIQAGAVIGSDGFGFARTQDGWQPIQQVGGVHIGDRVHIGANTTIDSGAIEPTRLADGVILDNQIQVAHNVQIGENTAIAGCTGIAGSTHIGRNCQIGGACNIVGHIRIADGVIINAASLVARSIEQPGRYGSGMPLQPEQAWRRSFVTLGRIDQLLRRVRRLERRHDAD